MAMFSYASSLSPSSQTRWCPDHLWDFTWCPCGFAYVCPHRPSNVPRRQVRSSSQIIIDVKAFLHCRRCWCWWISKLKLCWCRSCLPSLPICRLWYPLRDRGSEVHWHRTEGSRTRHPKVVKERNWRVLPGTPERRPWLHALQPKINLFVGYKTYCHSNSEDARRKVTFLKLSCYFPLSSL